MTTHKQRTRMECHYGGSLKPIPKQCPKCQSKYFYFFGEGSEHLEERLRKEFPGARIARLDRDTARTKRQYQETLGAFASGALDILVGTQMLAKGHDFQRVTLVGVVSADSSLSLPDFRAAESTFQLETRAGLRKEHRFQFLLKSPKRFVLTKLLSGAMTYCDAKEIPQTAVLVDMDPLSLL